MHLESFYVRPEDINGNTLSFPPNEVRHIAKVMRKEKGDTIWAVDGKGTALEVQLTRVTKENVEGEIISRRRKTGEPAAEIILAQAVLKGDHFDWIVEKAVELGISKIIPFECRYTQLKPGPGKINRWRKISLTAMKQCGRTVLPEVTESSSFQRVVSMGADCDHILIAHAGEKSLSVARIMKSSYSSIPKILLLVGPEGGFTDEEIREALEQGFQPVSLGPRRLRAETAAMTLMVQVMTVLEELS